MPRLNWKSLLLLAAVAAAGSAILISGIISTVHLPLFGWSGIAPLVALVALTVVSSRFIVPVTSVDGTSQTNKSVAEAFIFLAVIMYATAPANTLGPAILLAAIGGFIASLPHKDKWARLFAIGTSIVSTFLASLAYKFILVALGGASVSAGQSNFDVLLLPLCAFGFVQYALSTFGTIAFTSLSSGASKVDVSKESLVWTLITQVASVTSAALFFSAIHGAGIQFFFVGVLIITLVHLLFRFHEKRVSEVTRAQTEKLKYTEEIVDLHMNTIESLATSIDAKDQTTNGHVRRTQIYATEMGKLLKVSELERRALVAGALLHDIGKLAVPEYILNKPGKLTESEFAKMKIHPTVGGDILKRVNFPYPVEDIVRYHHEKWDGSGYPRGLKGQAIPLVARIISVVDFYDATRCDRPYRKGMKREESLALLRSMVGNAFDPRVVEMFIEHVVEFDRMIDSQDIKEQVASAPSIDDKTATKPDAGLAPDILGVSEEVAAGFRSISEAQREVFALHEIAQTIGSSLNLSDTVTLIANKLRAIVPFDTCVIYLVDDPSGKAIAAHVVGEEVELFK